MSDEKIIDGDKLLDAVLKKALGYTAVENTEESVAEDGRMTVVKQKVVSKEVPPDVAALKLLLERAGSELESMTEAELEAEKRRLIGLLAKLEAENTASPGF